MPGQQLQGQYPPPSGAMGQYYKVVFNLYLVAVLRSAVFSVVHILSVRFLKVTAYSVLLNNSRSLLSMARPTASLAVDISTTRVI